MDYLYIKIFDFTIVVYDLKQFANLSIYSLLLHTILAMESRIYVCRRCEKGIKSTNGLTRYINACKIPISLPCCQLSNSDLVLNYNMTNPLSLPSDNNKESITSKVSNNNDSERTRPANIGNDQEDIRPADIDKQRSATPSWTPQNKLLSELFSTFREVTFSKLKFPTSTPISNT